MTSRTKPKPSRMLIFLLAAVAVTVGMQLIDSNIVSTNTNEVEARAQVSKGDIRRGVFMSVDKGIKLLNTDESFLSRFATRSVNLLVVNIPLHIRSGNPVYLEYSALLWHAIEELIARSHIAGLETALNPVFTGDTLILNYPEHAESIYRILDDWYIRAIRTNADVIFLNPHGISSSVSTLLTKSTISNLQNSFGGSIYAHAESSTDPIVELYRSQIKGFVLPQSPSIDFDSIHTSATSDGYKTEFLFIAQRTANTNNTFEPYIRTEDSYQIVDITEYVKIFEELESSMWFRGVILPESRHPKFESIDEGNYLDTIGVWYQHLKRVSMQRAFHDPEGAIRR